MIIDSTDMPAVKSTFQSKLVTEEYVVFTGNLPSIINTV